MFPDADRRETLAWERELIGMYMSEHPLTPYLNEIRRLVTHFSSNLGEAAHEEKARVAGMVSGIRPYQTKTGKMMAWVTLEDLTGVIELVLFPRTWEKFQFALEVGGVIVAEGKVDAQSNPSKVLVDNIRTEIKLTEPAQTGVASNPQAKEPAQMYLQPQPPAPSVRISEHTSSFREAVPDGEEVDWETMPPPPDAPPEWENYFPAKGVFKAQDLIVHEPDLPVEPDLSGTITVLDNPTSVTASTLGIIDPQSPIEYPVAIINPIPKLPPETRFSNINEDHAPQMVTVILRPSGDPNRDIRRISRLHGTFISYPGKDRFAFQIFEEGRGHLIEFPNDTTHLCVELADKIKDVVGEENLRFEPILYQ